MKKRRQIRKGKAAGRTHYQIAQETEKETRNQEAEKDVLKFKGMKGYIVLPAAVKIRGAEQKDTSLAANTHKAYQVEKFRCYG